MQLKLPIISKNKIAKDTWEIGFDLQDKDFQFKPGQYIKVTLPKVDFNHPKGNLREFSIISDPSDTTRLLIAFRESDSDFKQALLAHDVGDFINISGPFGDFVLPKAQPKSIAMIAGGMGITPFLSMISTLTQQNYQTAVFLIYVNSKLETTAFLNLLENFQKKNPHFSFQHFQSRLTKKDLKNYLQDLKDESTFMLAGPPEMVTNTRINLEELGISRKQIIFEEFTGY